MRVVFTFRSDDLKECSIVEASFMEKYRLEFPDLLNDGGAGVGICPCSPWLREIRRKSLLGYKRPPGKKLTQEHKEAISRGHRGKILSPEHAAKCRVARLGIPHSEEIRKKIGDWSRGKKKSPETITRMKQGWEKRKLNKILDEY